MPSVKLCKTACLSIIECIVSILCLFRYTLAATPNDYETYDAPQLSADINISTLTHDITKDYIRIKWQTTVETSTDVKWGTNTTYGNSYQDGTSAINHIYTIYGPLYGNIYAELGGADNTGNRVNPVVITYQVSASGLPNATVDTLVISNIRVVSITPSKVTVFWTTNKPVGSKVYYGTTERLESQLSDSQATTNHVITIDNIQPATDYFFAVEGTGALSVRSPVKKFSSSWLEVTPIDITNDAQKDLTELLPTGVATPITAMREFFTKHSSGLPALLFDFVAMVASLVSYFIPFISSLLNFSQVLPYIQSGNIIPILAGLVRKKKAPWGIVFDANTKEPVDPVILTLTDSKGNQTQTVNDIFGRYEFLVEPGKYGLKAEKTNYSFPSSSLEGKFTDGFYDSLYFGKELIVESSQKIDLNIPMDQVATDWNQEEKRRMGIAARDAKIVKIANIIFYLGLCWNMAAAIMVPSTNNIILASIFTLMLGFRIYSRTHRSWGIIFNKDQKPIKGAIVKLINAKFPRISPKTLVTKESGIYSFLVQRGTYQVVVEQKTAEGAFSQLYKSEDIKFSGEYGSIGRDIILDLM